MSNKDIILGAGLTGLSAAFHLKKDYQVFEKDITAGGLCRSIHTNGFTFDFTGHLLHLRDQYAAGLVRSLLRHNLHTLERDSWIFSKETYTRYPFQAHTYGLSKKVIKECLSDYFAAQAKLKRFRKPPPSFLDWIHRHFGKGIARHFMVPYNEKLWQTPLDQLNSEWVGMFIPQPSIDDVLRGSMTDIGTSLGYNQVFIYPKKGGIQSLVNAFLEHIAPPVTHAEAVRIRWYDRRVEIQGKGPIMYRRLISTIPLPQLVRIMHRVPADVTDAARALRWVSVLCLNLGFDRLSTPKRNWIYFPEKDFVFYRVGFHSSFSPHMAPRGCSSVYVEISHRPEKHLNLKKILSESIKGLHRAGVIAMGTRILKMHIIPIPYAYVVYDHQRTEAVAVIQAFLRKHGIISTGRYGGWKYSYMEEAILDGKKAAEQVLNGF